jgi:hypothetical protein
LQKFKVFNQLYYIQNSTKVSENVFPKLIFVCFCI